MENLLQLFIYMYIVASGYRSQERESLQVIYKMEFPDVCDTETET